MNNQDQHNKEKTGSSPENENHAQFQKDKLTSVEENNGLENGIDEEASSRVRDDEQEALKPQIDKEGEFTNRTGWVREEGLSDQERREAEEEGLDGLRSGDSSAL